MVIIQSKSGRLANRLFIFSRFIANSIEYGHALANPTFDEYCKYFPSTRNNNFSEYPVSVSAPGNLPYKLFFPATFLLKNLKPSGKNYVFIRSEKGPFYDLNQPEFLQNAAEKTVYASGWFFNDRQNMIRHKDIIRSLFTPDTEVTDKISEQFTRLRKNGRALVGVHIRRGDYRRWQGGIHYFEDSYYAEKMALLENRLHEKGFSVTFLICSNETVDEKAYRQFSIEKGPGDMIGDLYSLASCDYIIGPPSTYSMWASYYGRKKLFHIRREPQDMNPDSFHIQYQ